MATSVNIRLQYSSVCAHILQVQIESLLLFDVGRRYVNLKSGLFDLFDKTFADLVFYRLKFVCVFDELV